MCEVLWYLHRFHSNAQRLLSPFADKDTSTHQELVKKGRSEEELCLGCTLFTDFLPQEVFWDSSHTVSLPLTPSDPSNHSFHLKTTYLSLSLE